MRVCFLSLSAIADDPRARRHGDTLADAGWDVTAIGLRGARSIAPRWPITEIKIPPGGPAYPLTRFARVALARLGPSQARAAYWSSAVNIALFSAGQRHKADLYVANDWLTLPACLRLAQENGGRVLYDSHEYAVQEGFHMMWWRLAFSPYVREIERAHIRQASAVMTVTPGIAQRLAADYTLDRVPHVVRNAPHYREMPFRPCGDTIDVLYHGLFRPERGLGLLIDSVAHWHPGLRLTLRGTGEARLMAELTAKAAAHGDRVTIAPPCLPADLVPLANRADVGVYPIPPLTVQTTHCLPNKFFEYMQAGLALAVSDGPEMVRLVREADAGIVVSTEGPAELARDLSALTPDRVNTYKENALVAARHLCWEVERATLFAAVEAAMVAAPARHGD